MRLFIAAELPDNMVDALAETSALLRESVRGRYVSPGSFHVTLAFLGNAASCLIGETTWALERGCAGFGPVEVALGDLGSFGRRSSATLWQGFHDAGKLSELAQSVRASLARSGVAFDEKAFLAHVTLMRAADLRTGTLPTPLHERGIIERISLFESDLSGKQPAYEPLHSVSLVC